QPQEANDASRVHHRPSRQFGVRTGASIQHDSAGTDSGPQTRTEFGTAGANVATEAGSADHAVEADAGRASFRSEPRPTNRRAVERAGASRPRGGGERRTRRIPRKVFSWPLDLWQCPSAGQ